MKAALFLLQILLGALLLLSGYLVWLSARLRHIDPRAHGKVWRAALLCLGFAALDWAWVLALPRLGISFGPPHTPLLFFTASRLAIYLVWLSVLVILVWPRRQKAAHTGPAAPTPLAPLWALNLGLLAVGLYGFVFEPFWVQVTHLEVAAPEAGLTEPLRIVQLSDLHVERSTRRERELVELVNSQQPDIIVLTGDFLNLSYLQDEQAVADLRALIAQLDAPLGIYAVDGTVEDPPRVREMLSDLGVRVLDQEVLCLPTAGGQIALVGVSNYGYAHDQETLAWLMQGVPPEEFSLVLHHHPDLAYDAQNAGVDLYLCGHTHGGQVRLPVYGAMITFSRFGKTFESGHYTLGDTTLYVSRGLGMEGSYAPRVRFLARPEVVVVDLMP
ncbi:MAG: metallophosphoesterase [Anaerolineaceae bacterium]|nr:metallophosphoesterase [Anaerolineaceae bacterium]